ncbi:hypothetical protein IU459_27140 [Nocardia amamiensis]|uniref:Uncharacterized protein n=1 Tax=Nocardia amamiensis TaxID=404578 RepID=A0ABS0CX71_9NOCA|nr:hypothetical protein [Nocardia amamiensis]MBF6301192.1 hypothetical protein [Nocardia amamiensis]
MSETPCLACERPVADHAPLCTKCGHRIVEALGMVPALLAEFAVTRAGLARMTAHQVGRSAEIVLPVRVTTGRGVVLAGDMAYHRLVNSVTTWARVLAEDLGESPYIGGPYLLELAAARRGAVTADRTAAALPVVPPDATAQAAVWLAHHRHQLRAHEAAAELLADITTAVDALTRFVDRPVERRYLGACSATLDDGQPCGYGLRAELDDQGRPAAYVYCGRCKTQYDVRRIEAEATALAIEQCYSLAELVRLLPALGHPVARPTLYRWASNDREKGRRIQARGWRHVDEHGFIRITDHLLAPDDEQVYRLGDVLDTAARERTAKPTKPTKEATA